MRHGLTETKLSEAKLFHFLRIFIKGVRDGGSSEPPEPPLDLPVSDKIHVHTLDHICIMAASYTNSTLKYVS